MIKSLPNLKLKFLKLSLCFTSLISFLPVFAQLPVEYISKVRFQEKTEVTYELVNDSSYTCLTSSELSRFHGYWTIINKTQLIDMDGRLHTQDVYVEEKDVRDAWMEGIGRVYTGPEFSELYTQNEVLVMRQENTTPSPARPLTEHEAIQFWNQALTDSTIQKLHNQFIEYGFVSVLNHGILKSKTQYTTTSYNVHNQTFTRITLNELDKRKQEEHLIHYQPNDNDNYYPETEITIEWIITENGCCVRKTTHITRSQYVVTIHPYFQNNASQPQSADDDKSYQNTNISLERLSGTEKFVIQHSKHKTAPVQVIVYDLSGRELLNVHTLTGESIKLPETTQTGMYLVHIYPNNKMHSYASKIILTSSNQQL